MLWMKRRRKQVYDEWRCIPERSNLNRSSKFDLMSRDEGYSISYYGVLHYYRAQFNHILSSMLHLERWWCCEQSWEKISMVGCSIITKEATPWSQPCSTVWIRSCSIDILRFISCKTLWDFNRIKRYIKYGDPSCSIPERIAVSILQSNPWLYRRSSLFVQSLQ